METQETINYIIDTQIEYNMKIIFMAIITIYTLIAYFYFKRNEPKIYAIYLFKRLNQAFIIAWFFFLPLYIGTLYRTISFEFFLIPMMALYGIFFGIAPIMFMFGYGEIILGWIFKKISKNDWIRFNRGEMK